MFDVTNNPDGSVNIANVPIFKAHSDRRYNCDENWLDRCVADFMGQKIESLELADGDARYAMLPSVTIGHTPEDPNAPEPDNHGFLDNVRRVGRVLYADLMSVSKEAWQKIKAGKLPFRSAEVIPSKHRITNLSLLGGRYPHFALPVMRFRSRQHGMVLRYTFTTEDKPMPAPAAANPELLQLAQAIAPMVADIMAQKDAAAAESDMSAAGTADPEQGSSSPEGVDGVDEQGQPPEEELGERHPYRAKGTTKPGIRERVERHGGAAVSASGKRANGFKSDSFSPNTEGNEAPMTGSDIGITNPARSADKSIGGGATETYSAVQRENAALRATVERLTRAVGDLQRHQAEDAQAAKRMMIRSKVREIAATYAIGDRDQIERHVDRMMGMSADGVKSYMDDVLKAFPKFGEARQTYGGAVHDVVRRPGSMDDNERYAAENPDRMQKLGLDASILKLADALGGD